MSIKKHYKTAVKWPCALSGPVMSTTKLQIFKPKRKMHGKHENTIKLQEKCPPSHPAGALPEPPGALGEPHLPLMPPSTCSSSLKIGAAKLLIHEPRRKMHEHHENTIKLQEKCPPSHPAGALPEPPGALGKPHLPPCRCQFAPLRSRLEPPRS